MDVLFIRMSSLSGHRDVMDADFAGRIKSASESAGSVILGIGRTGDDLVEHAHQPADIHTKVTLQIVKHPDLSNLALWYKIEYDQILSSTSDHGL